MARARGRSVQAGQDRRACQRNTHRLGQSRQRATLRQSDDGLGFSRAPWQQLLDRRRIGRHVAGIPREAGIEWTFGRKRGLDCNALAALTQTICARVGRPMQGRQTSGLTAVPCGTTHIPSAGKPVKLASSRPMSLSSYTVTRNHGIDLGRKSGGAIASAIWVPAACKQSSQACLVHS
jgi:hypothetical protein